ncbi:MAG TPA: UDP-glucuronic acid decarboxylase family protein [Polyangia bacterium]|nr:UDP-glucuronic acid decarboxylase family protein [Polyangia bacterium]
MARRVLVTGGAGFLGSHLCERLVADGCDVICLDNFFTGRRENLDRLWGSHAFELLRHDVTEAMTLEVDEIYHLACPASPVHYQRNPVRTIRTGVVGTANMLDVARDARARILIASTSEVYGDPAVHPQPEEYWGHVNPIGSRACYDESKRCAEALAVSYARQYATEVRIVRIFNTFGPRLAMDDGRVISNFIVQALRGEPLTIYGDGAQTRSFCYVSDLIEGLLLLMKSDLNAQPINIGNPGEFTMRELAEKVLSLTGSRSEVVYRPLPQDDPKQRRPDISRARKLLGWEPRVPLEEGLRHTIEYFRERLHSGR